jgi:hypothetical protein
MALQLPDKWVWDFWLIRDAMDYHAFYLQAPRSLGDPELRPVDRRLCMAHPPVRPWPSRPRRAA